MDPAAIEKRVRDSFARQAFMTTVGARMATVRAGHVEIELPFAVGNTQQHGFIHGGLVASIADSACGYAALTTMPGPRPNAAARATSMSVVTRTRRPICSLRSARSSSSRSADRPAPAAPTTIASAWR